VSVVFSFPGKSGDAMLQWPVAYQFGKLTGENFEVWLDETTCKMVAPLFQAQPNVSAVKLISGVENWNCGGQPFHMNLPTSAFEGNTIYHLGLRAFPVRQITLQTLNDAKLPFHIHAAALSSEPSIVAEPERPANRLILHGQGVCPHSKTTPAFWKFLAGARHELMDLFDEIVFVGSTDDLEVAAKAYPDWPWLSYADNGDFLKLAGFIAGSRAMIGCGSAPVVLAGCLKIPAIRVHDEVGNGAPKVIWSNLGENQLNDTEIGLRTEWPRWRDKWLTEKAVDSAEPATETHAD